MTTKKPAPPTTVAGLEKAADRLRRLPEPEPQNWYALCKAFCEKIGKKPWSKNHIWNRINYSRFLTNVITNPGLLPPPEKHVRPLTALLEQSDRLAVVSLEIRGALGLRTCP